MRIIYLVFDSVNFHVFNKYIFLVGIIEAEGNHVILCPFLKFVIFLRLFGPCFWKREDCTYSILFVFAIFQIYVCSAINTWLEWQLSALGHLSTSPKCLSN